MKTKIIFSISILFLLSSSIFAQVNTPDGAVTSFYKFHLSHSDIFNARQISLRKSWFSGNLNGLFQNELKREKVYLKANPTDKPFFGDGLPFQPLDECVKAGKSIKNSYKIGKTSINENKAVVEISFYNPRACGGELVDTYKIELIKSKTNWLIDNWIYSDGRTLIDDLTRKEY